MIETLEDWNYYLAACCGCPMPDFGEPVWVCESIEVDLSRCMALNVGTGTAGTPCAVLQGWWRTVVVSFTASRPGFGSGSEVTTYTSELSGLTCNQGTSTVTDGTLPPEGPPTFPSDWGVTNSEGWEAPGIYFFQTDRSRTGNGYTETSRRTLSGLVEDPLAELLAQSGAIAAAAWADPEFGEGSLVVERGNLCETETVVSEQTGCTPPLPIRSRSQWVRYRPEPPEEHPGTWYKATWDIEEVPLSGPVILIEEGLTWEFERATAADDWPLADWFFIEPSPVPGTIRRRANLCYSGYRSPYGTPVKAA